MAISADAHVVFLNTPLIRRASRVGQIQRFPPPRLNGQVSDWKAAHSGPMIADGDF
jgi:hypothetical protein